MQIVIAEAGAAHADAVFGLYVKAAEAGTLGRDPGEYALADVVRDLADAVGRGLSLGAFEQGALVGYFRGVRLAPRRFHHVFSGLTIAVDPGRQGRGIGRRLLVDALTAIDGMQPPVLRVELILQAGNPGAEELYRSLGFVEEGRLKGRVRSWSGELVDDIYMGRTMGETDAG